MDSRSELRDKIDSIVNQPEIQYDRTHATIIYKGLNLNAINPTSQEVLLTVGKQPLLLSEGKSFAGFAVLMDQESEKMKQLSEQANSMRNLPEQQRIKEVLELLSNNVHYAYKDVVSGLYQKNQELAKWVEANVVVGARTTDIPLSEVIDKGYGVCGHLSVAYLWLAQKAGLEGTLMSCDHNTIKNIARDNTDEKLFKSTDIGQTVSAHMWAEIQTANNLWVPVDPSTRLIGDSEENLSMFQRANYIGNGNLGLDVDAQPKELTPKNTGVSFKPGEVTTQARYSLLLSSTMPTMRFAVGSPPLNIPPTNVPYSGEGKLQINTTQFRGTVNLAILDVKNPDPK
jgi:hypothetical protein